MISSIKIKGFRGFADEQELKISIPNGRRGSGLTIVVGPNNGGKSTIIESFMLMALTFDSVNFTEGQRNKKAGDRVEIVLSHDNANEESLKTTLAGNYRADFSPSKRSSSIRVLQSRRFFNPYSAVEKRSTLTLAAQSGIIGFRGETIDDAITTKFLYASGDKRFNELLEKITGKEINWTVDLHETGNYYIKINLDNEYYHSHNSDGLGGGLVSVLFLVESLFNPVKDQLIVIDEPELSLHPQLQRNLLDFILDYSKDYQILYATHSPEMVSIDSILNGGTLCRVENQDNGSKIHKLDLDKETRKFLEGCIENINNPHVFGYDARSCFFVDDRLVIVEGQEDAVLLNKGLSLFGIKEKINFFGFGAGGAENIKYIVKILSSLGFKRVCCLYDNDPDSQKEKEKTEELFPKESFPYYDFKLLNAPDIRDKECTVMNICKKMVNKESCEDCKNRLKQGVFDKNKQNIKVGYKEGFENILKEIAEKYGY